MAATWNWAEDNGAQTGSPLHGTTRNGFSTDTHIPTDVSWKNTDDAVWSGGGTPFTSSPIIAGSNSFTKYQYGQLSGTFTLIASGKFTHTAGVVGTGVTLKGTVTSTYATPSATTNAALTTDLSTADPTFSSALTVNFSTTGPQDASPTSTLTAPGYTQYCPTQLQTTGSAAAGSIASLTLGIQYVEN